MGMNDRFEVERERCWLRFNLAAAALKRGDSRLARALVERVREQHGSFAAAVARRELYAYAGVLT